MRNTFDSNYGKIILSMKRHLDSIPPARQLEGIKENRQQCEGRNSFPLDGRLTDLESLAQTEAELNEASQSSKNSLHLPWNS